MRTAGTLVLATLMLATALSACSTMSAAAVSVRPQVSLADTWTHVLYVYSGAGHYVGSFSPYEPAVPADATWSADQEAAPLLWQHLLGFLGGLAASPPT